MAFWHRDEHRVDRDVDRDVTESRRVWSPWALFALAVGVASIVLGAWAIGRTGLNTDHWFTPTREVLGVRHTAVLALGEIAFGVLVLAAASGGWLGRIWTAMYGTAAIVFGVLVVAHAWSGRLREWTGLHDRNGWVYLGGGAVAVFAVTLPTVVAHRTVVHDHDQVVREVPREQSRVDDTRVAGGPRRHWWQRGQPSHA
jgi:hypothetical protein